MDGAKANPQSVVALIEGGEGAADAPWACASCHGDEGQGAQNIPRLAGLPAGYLVKQLHDRLTAPDKGDGTEARIVAEMRRVAVRLVVSIAFGMWTMLLSILLYLNPDNIAAGATGQALAMAAGAMALSVVTWVGAPICSPDGERRGWACRAWTASSPPPRAERRCGSTRP